MCGLPAELFPWENSVRTFWYSPWKVEKYLIFKLDEYLYVCFCMMSFLLSMCRLWWVQWMHKYVNQRSITGFYAKPTNYTSVGVSVGRGVRSRIERQPVITSPQSSKKDGRATDSCFALMGAHQCGILMVDGWMTGCFCIHPMLNTCGFNRNNKGGYSHHDWSFVERGRLLAVSHCRDNRLKINHWIF